MWNIRYNGSMDRDRVVLLGVPIDAVTSDEAVEALMGFLKSGHLARFFHVGGQYHVMTPNSEMLVEASRNEEFKKLLNQSSLNLPDGVGLLMMAKMTGQHLPERVTGVDTVARLCEKLPERHSVFLLGAGKGVAERAAKVIKKTNPELTIAGTFSGSPCDEDAPDIVARIRKVKPHVLFVAFGAPAQDLWIHKYLKELPSVRVAMGVGGTFDLLAGKQKRAPKWMCKVGLEWLARLIRQPKRFRRIFNAVVVFPLLVMTKKQSAR